MFQQGGEHGAGAEGPIPPEPDRGTAAAASGQPGGVKSPLTHYQTLRWLPVHHQWHSLIQQPVTPNRTNTRR